MRELIGVSVLVFLVACGSASAADDAGAPAGDAGCGQVREFCAAPDGGEFGYARVMACAPSGEVVELADCWGQGLACSGDPACPPYVDGGRSGLCCL